ncbi:MAG: cytidine deaminase family protein [Candidatus Rifleibacteriota bacterium]
MTAHHFDELLKRAREAVNPRRLSEFAESGGVAAAIQTSSNKIYVGVCIDTTSSMGFCAEHAAAAAMVTAGENQVTGMVAVNWQGDVYPPCGRCREFISQLHPMNLEAEIMVGSAKIVKLSELLPHNWQNVVPRKKE